MDLNLRRPVLKKGIYEVIYEYQSGVLSFYPLIDVGGCVIEALLGYGKAALTEQPKARRVRLTVVTTFAKENRFGEVVGIVEKKLVSYEMTRRNIERVNADRFLQQLRYPPTWKVALRKVKRLLSKKYCNRKLLQACP